MFAVAIALDLGLIFTLIQTVINPAQHQQFLFNGGVALLIGELIAVVASAMLTSKQNRGLMGLAMYLAILFPWLYVMFLITDSAFLVSMLVASFSAKVLFAYSVSDSSAATKAITFFVSTMVLLVFGFVLERIAQPPAEVMQLAPPGAGGQFIEHPQVAPLWGIFHYSLGLVLEVLRAFRIGKVGKLLASVTSHKTHI